MAKPTPEEIAKLADPKLLACAWAMGKLNVPRGYNISISTGRDPYLFVHDDRHRRTYRMVPVVKGTADGEWWWKADEIDPKQSGNNPQDMLDAIVRYDRARSNLPWHERAAAARDNYRSDEMRDLLTEGITRLSAKGAAFEALVTARAMRDNPDTPTEVAAALSPLIAIIERAYPEQRP